MVTDAMGTLTPGLYPGIPESVYRPLVAMNKTTIGRGLQSPTHLRHALEHPEAWEETESLRFGKLFHMALLEPERYAVEVGLDYPLNKGKPYGFDTKARREAEEIAGKMLVSPDDAARITAMVRKVLAHKSARKLIDRRGDTEVVALWTCPATGVLMKMRVDFIAVGVGSVDVKTTDDASPSEFENSVSRFGYDIQAALYSDGLRVLTGDESPFAILAVEKEPPHEVAVYEISPGAVARGRRKYRNVLRDYAACVKSGVWPAYPENPVMLDSARWDQGPGESFESPEVTDDDPFASTPDEQPIAI